MITKMQKPMFWKRGLRDQIDENSHDVIDQRTYKVKETVVNRESDLVEATNQFDDVAGDITYVSRADWKGTMPKEKAKDQAPSKEVLKALQNTKVETDPDAEDIVFKNTD